MTNIGEPLNTDNLIVIRILDAVVSHFVCSQRVSAPPKIGLSPVEIISEIPWNLKEREGKLHALVLLI